MSVINTNVMSLNTQLNLSRSQSALGTAIERLSSGMRINSAKDDAAGQAIANRFTSNIKGLAQARRNAMDGISIAQTTEGALNEINNNLQRVRELSVQAANGSNSKSDLDSIQAEVSQRLSEIDRISDQTQFNGKKVLAEDSVLKLQVGAYDSETIDVNLVKTNVQELGLKDFNINAITPAAVVDTPTAIVDADVAGLQTVLGNSNTGVKAAGVSFTIDGTNFGLAAGAATADGVFKDANGDFYVGVSFAGATGEDLTKLEAAGLDTANTFYLKLPVSGTTVTGTNEANAGDGDGTLAIAFGSSQVSLSSVVADTNFVSTQPARTENPLAAIDNALKTIDTLRGDLGAVQNRLESTITNLGTAVNNLSASRSRIEDADYAVEVSNMSRAQILQQAGTSVLAQANQVPQTVLSLLR